MCLRGAQQAYVVLDSTHSRRLGCGLACLADFLRLTRRQQAVYSSTMATAQRLVDGAFPGSGRLVKVYGSLGSGLAWASR